METITAKARANDLEQLARDLRDLKEKSIELKAKAMERGQKYRGELLDHASNLDREYRAMAKTIDMLGYEIELTWDEPYLPYQVTPKFDFD